MPLWNKGRKGREEKMKGGSQEEREKEPLISSLTGSHQKRNNSHIIYLTHRINLSANEINTKVFCIL